MTSSEVQFVKKLDKCLYDSLIKFSGSVVVGGIASLLFLKRRKWPIIAGAGFGVGYAYSNCEHELNKSFVTVKSVQ
ncbi:MICOS complex subunit Mic10-like [Planococcus citri]|uniref:MICOS complex subunit Mic10-like n=1 Tax=Planococcus citri TaxID=170843 RepID=UPI0031F9AFFB